MINSIMKAIGISLNAEFGSKYESRMEEGGQDLKKPCFFIQCLNSANDLFRGRKYFRSSQFCIRYFPENELQKNAECNEAAERLFSCLQWLTVNGDLIMGTKMKCEMADGVLDFFVNYDMYVYSAGAAIPAMEEMAEEVSVKE